MLHSHPELTHPFARRHGQVTGAAGGGGYTYYAPPVVSHLIPPGGPVLGASAVTLVGAGFDGLAADFGGFGCTFGATAGVAVSMAARGDEVSS